MPAVMYVETHHPYRTTPWWGFQPFLLKMDRKLQLWLGRHQLLLLLLLGGVVVCQSSNPTNSCLDKVRLPRGFSISSYAQGKVPKARSLVLSRADNGGKTVVYVSTRKASNVYALIDDDGDGRADHVHVVIDDMRVPNGIAWRNGSLFVAQINKVWRYDDVDSQAINGQMFRAPVLVSDAFPSDVSHGWKYIAFGPDDRLYVPVGAPCDSCILRRFGNIRYGTINRMNADGTGLEIFATGVRNTVGFDWHPQTGEMWFTDNGRDHLGDNDPDDELNRAWKSGLDFGFPQCHSKAKGNPFSRPVQQVEDLEDPTFGPRNGCQGRAFERAVQPLGPHVAALGMLFYTGKMFPRAYRNSIFIAEHGSWNREDPIGYRVVNVRLDRNGTEAHRRRNFAEGWLDKKTGDSCGRPVDVLQLNDGSLLVSDDAAGDVYRITYQRRSKRTLG